MAKLAHRYRSTTHRYTPPGTGGKQHKTGKGSKSPTPPSPQCWGKNANIPDITLEFVHTHSIPTVHAVLHTSEGIIVYALDFKFDNHMMLSPPPDYQRLRELGNQGVLALIVETTRMTDQHQEKTHSEKVTRIVLEDIMRDMLPSKEGLLVTTFSSHIERIQAICNIAKESNRKIMLLGRSMERFGSMAEKIGILDLPKSASIFGSPKAVNRALARAEENRSEYLLVTTGHQGEPDALLPRIASGRTQFNVRSGDNVVISAPIIPNPTNMANRNLMERRLKDNGARIYTNVYVSGHAGRNIIEISYACYNHNTSYQHMVTWKCFQPTQNWLKRKDTS